jgi:hypothetical protein
MAVYLIYRSSWEVTFVMALGITSLATRILDKKLNPSEVKAE